MQQARQSLPRIDQQVYDEVRRELDEDYRKRQDRERAESERAQRELAEREARDREFYINRYGMQGAPGDTRDIDPRTGYVRGGQRDRTRSVSVGVLEED